MRKVLLKFNRTLEGFRRFVGLETGQNELGRLDIDTSCSFANVSSTL